MKHLRSDVAYWRRYRTAWGKAERRALKALRERHEQEFLLIRQAYLAEELKLVAE